jgi:hypothetical protein
MARAEDVTAAVESVKVARESRAGNEEFRINEARIDLSGAKHEVLLIIRDLDTHIELAQESAQDAARRADEELSGVLDKVLRRLGRAGRKLLSMNLQLLPVKEWSLGGEVSALFVKGSVSVTFGK